MVPGVSVCVRVCMCVCTGHTGQHALKQQTIFVSSDPSALTAIKSLQKLKAIWTEGLIWLKVKAFVQFWRFCQHVSELPSLHWAAFTTTAGISQRAILTCICIKPNGFSLHRLYMFGLFVCFCKPSRIVKIHKMVLVLVLIYLESQLHDCSGHDI